MAATKCERGRPPPRPRVPPRARGGPPARPAPPRCCPPLKSEPPPPRAKPTPAVRKSLPSSTQSTSSAHRPSTLPTPRRRALERHVEEETLLKAKEDAVNGTSSSPIVSKEQHGSVSKVTSSPTNEASRYSAPREFTRQSPNETTAASQPGSESPKSDSAGRATVDDMQLGQRLHHPPAPRGASSRPKSAGSLSLIPPRDRLRRPSPLAKQTKPPRPPPPKSFGGNERYCRMDEAQRPKCDQLHVKPSVVILDTIPDSGEPATAILLGV